MTRISTMSETGGKWGRRRKEKNRVRDGGDGHIPKNLSTAVRAYGM